jgi:hypothetical protein
MAANIIDIKSYSPKSSDIFFFDNNIWMFLFCPLGNYNQNKQKHFSSFFQSIQSLKCGIFINSLVVSEFVNRNLRIDFELWKKDVKNYGADYKKDFVGSERYKDTVIEIQITINKILKICEKSSDNFNAIDIKDILLHLEYIDFNDSYYLALAKLSKWKIVTDDGDFIKYSGHQVDILTIVN